MFSVNVSDQAATIIMQSPPVNALSEDWVVDFLLIIDEFAGRHDWKVLHVRSDQKAFCAGVDLKEMRSRFDAPDGPNRTYAYVGAIQRGSLRPSSASPRLPNPDVTASLMNSKQLIGYRAIPKRDNALGPFSTALGSDNRKA